MITLGTEVINEPEIRNTVRLKIIEERLDKAEKAIKQLRGMMFKKK